MLSSLAVMESRSCLKVLMSALVWRSSDLMVVISVSNVGTSDTVFWSCSRERASPLSWSKMAAKGSTVGAVGTCVGEGDRVEDVEMSVGRIAVCWALSSGEVVDEFMRSCGRLPVVRACCRAVSLCGVGAGLC